MRIRSGTHATQPIENGATPNGVAGRLGHANVDITQNLYTHTTQKLQKKRRRFSPKICRRSSFTDKPHTSISQSVEFIKL